MQSGKMIGVFLLYATCFITVQGAMDWSGVDKILQNAIVDGAFPGCVALVAGPSGIVYSKAFGNFTYGVPPPLNNKKNPPMTINTLFDLASLTKVVGATSAIAQFYQKGQLSLDTKVVDILGPQYGTHGKDEIRILNLLLHNAGYPADPVPNYNSLQFDCPETHKYHPAENFSCRDKIYKALLNQTLTHPVGENYTYSDLSYITLMYVVGRIAKNLNYVTTSDLLPNCLRGAYTPAADQCYFEAYLRKYVFTPLKMKNTRFLPPSSVWPNCAPTENDTVYMHEVIQGKVSDPNAYALGGIADVMDLYTLMNRLMFATPNDSFLNSTTVKLFTTEYNHTQSSRALGWNTNDPGAYDYGWGLLCGNMSATTWMHTGYTGTELCGDPQRQLFTILLTNRVYPTAANLKIANVRRHFNSEVVRVWDEHFDFDIAE